ncbi:tetratricopeptide repeat protein [Massilia sp. R2A-15]|uniref:tetratricopeptide repeat protein n=1 Tax=Massilia sp. R2A-15 TaxID=3064278 RepID=UPI002732354C|nr:tetratricopeptide repeat protein [Massilia sp. R2A-15]WLI90119.1 tetratricopeptide repeat protein [Massilia sp. R2A-15]
MSQFRLARISLMMAAIGLAAPVLMSSAFAQQTPPAPAAAAAKPADTVRPELFKLLDPAAVKQLITDKKYDELKTRITQADAFPAKTPYETYVLDRMKVAYGSATGDEAMMTTALEAVVNSGRMPAADQAEFVLALGNSYYNAKNYAKAIEWFKRYQKESPTPQKAQAALIRAYYLSNDYATAKTMLVPVIAESEKSGQPPSQEDLRLLGSAASKVKDEAVYVSTLEKLVAYYPTDELWTDLLHRAQSKPTFNAALDIDALRLMMVAEKQLAPEEYTELAELALRAGFPTEAKKAIDAGFAANVLGTGSNAAKHKSLRDRANKGAADDAKNIASGEAGAAKAKDGTGLVNLGYAYVTMDQFDKGIPLMEQGIAKGVGKRPEDAKLHLGIAYAKAGRKADAIKTFQSIKGTDGAADLAKYWTLWVNRGAAVAAAPAPVTK